MLALAFGTPIGITFSNEILMRNVIQFDGIKFWVDQNIIYCNLDADFFENHQKANIEEIFYNAISILYNREYMPFLINLEQISYYNSLKIFKLISNSGPINTLVLSRIFLVRSIGLKVVLSLHKIVVNRVFQNKIHTDFNLAIKYCNNDYMVFNKAS